MDKFGDSIAAAVAGAGRPRGWLSRRAHITDPAARILAEHPEFAELTGSARTEAFREAGYVIQLQQQKDVLDLFRTHFDVASETGAA